MACMRPLSARRSLPVLPCRELSVRPLVSRHVFLELRTFHAFHAPWEEAHAPLRKQLKQAAKSAKLAKAPGSSPEFNSNDTLNDWELTVGIEIHAQLNTARKLFSSASTTPSTEPNSNVAAFDIALPGTLPVFQPAVVLPALRAALVLGCRVEPVSYFDRKHYFYHDQPAGYQITQYYHPFARHGRITLSSDDGLPDGEQINVRIKQVQLEQDTARSQEEDEHTTLLDFNRSGHALIEIISLPDIHSPRHAAAYVRKVQALLYAVDAVTTGMELGGLRADVNVSVRRRNTCSDQGLAYGGVSGLGQRTEIKNLSTFKGIEDAITAERDRQIKLLESGGRVEPETRGWSMTHPNETRRLRGKEGEVDYRYMPDADVPPLCFDMELVDYLSKTLPPTPEVLVRRLIKQYGLSLTDARTLESLDDGERLIYFQEVVDELLNLSFKTESPRDVGKLAGNWVLHELGSLFSVDESPWSSRRVPTRSLAHIIHHLRKGEIKGPSAKLILKLLFKGDRRTVSTIIRDENLSFTRMSPEEYEVIATDVIERFPDTVKEIVQKGKVGKLQFLMGQMMRHPRRSEIEPPQAEKTLRQLILGEKP
ncbi:aspartyl/glutamyl-tRNA(Asn/Gln) amidotransferase, B subunit [Exophiala spinifera]|uniref:Glutamyl-tRNA(Gln) amidotransferase subunit B, mitochondrial n=1 Tax=Exophiala spinifera TaxID=91928 RepID=A0A0D1ZEK6_9EURO|nr:aspartyl/glutamyl-tRNA(Asn/Gln) amidotransferase, B subunit [Exophiala spinifera]KIW11407.1 aspartyl/glutamyl-tRNA(Asn/Gln) amidotransferase, B subunit [Exophiala spinifera]